MTEIWKDIEGFIGVYKVSNTGKILSLERAFIKSNNRRAYFPQKELIQYKRGSGKKKYLAVKLCFNGVKKTSSVHILVARHFVDGYFEGAQVNHIDGDKFNNNDWNLEWTDNSGNQKHAYELGLNKVSDFSIKKLVERSTGKNNHKAIPLIDTITGEKFDTIRQAAIKYGINENKLYSWVKERNKNKSTLKIDYAA